MLREVYAVVGQGDVTPFGVDEANVQLLCQCLTELGKGVGIIKELLAGYPFAQSHRAGWEWQMLPHVGDCPSGLHSQDVPPSAVYIIEPAEIASRVISVGV